VHEAVKWYSPLYEIEGPAWFPPIHCFTEYVKVAFFRGASLRPKPAWRIQAKAISACARTINSTSSVLEWSGVEWASQMPGEKL
jgi:hypothetical protein